ncbi:hypothetical protein [Massilia sp.]|uniref:hypothetical protein n=1 Tax=Massilia sp. TaxID=1882437 RepID=UPI0028AE6330|nr:hypothetical protein [Massilia sp.]
MMKKTGCGKGSARSAAHDYTRPGRGLPNRQASANGQRNNAKTDSRYRESVLYFRHCSIDRYR